MYGLALLLYLFDPCGGKGEGIDIVGLVGVGFSETGADKGLGGVWDAPAVEGGDDVLDEIQDVVGGVLGWGEGGGTDGVVSATVRTMEALARRVEWVPMV